MNDFCKLVIPFYVLIALLLIPEPSLSDDLSTTEVSLSYISENLTNNTNGTQDEGNATRIVEYKPVIWNTSTGPINNLTINSTCEVIIGEPQLRGEFGNETVQIFTDECTDELARKFMTCNPIKKICECYRDWEGVGYPNYTDPEFETKMEWFVYEKEAGECVVKTHMKCGLVNGASPYRCEKDGRCVGIDKREPVFLFCKLGKGH